MGNGILKQEIENRKLKMGNFFFRFIVYNEEYFFQRRLSISTLILKRSAPK